ncbi:MAG: alpha/beta hydrolase family protein, partial [Kiritimatiellae bacterium]|nr:alpha/beta hydrolase family protein [Kiritimatiellia bacterium]
MEQCNNNKKTACLLWLRFFIFFGVMLLPSAYGQGDSQAEELIAVPAAGSYTAEPFTYKRVFREQVRNHLIYDITYPSAVVSDSAQNNVVPAELYLPVGVTPQSALPAVVCMHILNGDFALCRMICSRLSEAGVAAIFFKQPYYGARGGSEGRRALLKSVDTLITGFDQSTADARRCLDVVQGVSGIDPHKLGVAGISLGAIRAGALCAFEPRIQRAYLALVAGDLKQVILSARETRDLREFIGKQSAEEQERIWECVMRQDPLNAVPQLKRMAGQNRLRMVRAEKDEIMPPACSLKLFNAVGSQQSEISLAGVGHYSAMAGLAGIMDGLTAFFAADVPATWHPPENTQHSAPVELVGSLLKDLAALLAASPKEGCAHMIALQSEITADGKPFKVNFELALGTEGRFKLAGTFPEVGHAGLGRGEFPWIIGGQSRVFCGTRAVDPQRALANLIDPQALLYYRMALGLVTGSSLAPELIHNYAVLSEEKGEQGQRILALKELKRKLDG